MSTGTTYKQCGCRDAATGRPLGRKCPRLRRGGGWNPGHGTWYYQLEMPARADGTRRAPLRAGGFATKTAAEADLGAARDLLAIAPPGELETARRIAAAITASLRDPRAPRPRPGPRRGRGRPGPGGAAADHGGVARRGRPAPHVRHRHRVFRGCGASRARRA